MNLEVDRPSLIPIRRQLTEQVKYVVERRRRAALLV
jgi:hypothetical protein